MSYYDEFGNLIDGRRSGLQGYMLFSGAVDPGAYGSLPFMTPPPQRSASFPQLPVQPVDIPIRAWGMQVTRRFAVVTSSCHYDPDTDVVNSAAIPTGLSMEVRAEGSFHIDIIPPTLLLALMSGAEPSRVILGIDYLTPYFEGDCMVSNFVCSTPVNDVVTYQCSIRPYGAFTLFPSPSNFGG